MEKNEFIKLNDTTKYYLFKSAKETIQIQNDLILSLKVENRKLEKKIKSSKSNGQWGDH